jgi:DNA-binding response OmpR family regulator
MELICKPFATGALVRRVRAMLEASMDRRVRHAADTKSG